MNTVLFHHLVRRFHIVVVVVALALLGALACSPTMQSADPAPQMPGAVLAWIPRGSVGGG